MPIKSPTPIEKNLFPSSVILVFGIFIFLFFFFHIETEDIWIHLSTGQWIIKNLYIPHVDPFPFNHENTPWICFHWLGSTLLYLIFKVGGLIGLKIFRSLFFILVASVAYLYARKHLPFSVLISLILLMILGLSGRHFLKPDMFNFIFIQIFLINLLAYQDDGQGKRLVILPILGILWFNIHLGALIYGGLLISIFLFSSCIKYLNIKINLKEPVDTLSVKKQIKALTLILLIYLGGFLINPFGVDGFLYPFKTFLFHDSNGFYNLNNVVMELLPAFKILTPSHLHFQILILLGFLALFFKNKNRLTLVLLYMISLSAFLYVTRNSGFFTIVDTYIIIESFKGASLKNSWSKFSWPKTMDYLLLFGLMIFWGIQIFTLCNKRVNYNHQSINYLTVIENPTLEYSIQFLMQNNIGGAVFNDEPSGGQMIWSGYPSLRPFLDGRFMSPQRLKDYNTILKDPEKYWPDAEKNYGFQIILVNLPDVDNQKLLKYLKNQNSWQLISISGPFVIFVKKTAYPHLPPKLNDLEMKLNSISILPDDIKTLKTLLNKPHESKPKSIIPTPAPIDLDTFPTVLSLISLGYYNAAVKYEIKALRINDHPMVNNIGAILLRYAQR